MTTTAERTTRRAAAPSEVPEPTVVRPRPTRGGLLAYWFVSTRQTRGMRVALAEGGYVGATLIVGGATILLALYWRELTSAALLAVFAAVLGGLGLAVAGGPANLARLRDAGSSVRPHVAGTLFALAAGCTAGAVAVVASAHDWSVGSAAGLLIAILGYALLPTPVGLLAGVLLGTVLSVSTVAEYGQLTPLSMAGALLCAGTVVSLLAVLGLLRHRELGLGAGATIALVGAQQPLANADTIAWAYGLTLMVGLACLALYLELSVTSLLVVGVLATAVAVCEATWDLTSGPAGVAATLVATGLALIATSALGLRLWQGRRSRVVVDLAARPAALRRDKATRNT